tara:strand:+ start:1314 stop:1535 length:222 start_codon:yes stop_codon:yes gene_type:complete
MMTDKQANQKRKQLERAMEADNDRLEATRRKAAATVGQPMVGPMGRKIAGARMNERKAITYVPQAYRCERLHR